LEMRGKALSQRHIRENSRKEKVSGGLVGDTKKSSNGEKSRPMKPKNVQKSSTTGKKI